MLSILRAENVEQPGHHKHHGKRADPADGRGIALQPVADLEGQIVHIDGPGVGGRGPVEATEDQILVDDRHGRAKAQHHQYSQNRAQARNGHVPEQLPLVGPVDAGRFV